MIILEIVITCIFLYLLAGSLFTAALFRFSKAFEGLEDSWFITYLIIVWPIMFAVSILVLATKPFVALVRKIVN